MAQLTSGDGTGLIGRPALPVSQLDTRLIRGGGEGG